MTRALLKNCLTSKNNTRTRRLSRDIIRQVVFRLNAFSTQADIYRDMELSKKLPSMSDDEQLELLATDGMLVKRPLVIGDGFVLVGFKENERAEKLV